MTTVTTPTTTPPTTTRSTQSTTKTTTSKPIQCENGGTPHPNNLACICLSGYTGLYCSNVNNEIVQGLLKSLSNIKNK